MHICVSARIGAQLTSVVLCALPMLPEGGAAQPASEPQEGQLLEDREHPASSIPEIVVHGRRIDEPDIVLDQDAVSAFGASTMAELAGRIAEQTGREQPAILINGRRSTFAEFALMPPEALERLEILPPDAAMKYGFSPGQRVINFILKKNFRAITAEPTFRAATQGGRAETSATATLTRLLRLDRLNIGVEYNRATSLYESERQLQSRFTAATGGAPSPVSGTGRDSFRTLLPSSERLAFTGSFGTKIADGLTMSASLTAETSEQDGAVGLPWTADGERMDLNPLRTHSVQRRLGGSVTLQGDAGKWNWSTTGRGDASWSRTDTERDGLVGPLPDPVPSVTRGRYSDVVTSNSVGTSIELLSQGPLVRLPAGTATANIRGSLSYRERSNDAILGGIAQDLHFNVFETDWTAALALPLISRAGGFLDALGDVSATLALRRSSRSGAGVAEDITYGLRWAPIPALEFGVRITDARGLPPVELREAPILRLPNVPIFDFVRGETAHVTLISGGNSDLSPESRQDLAIEGQLRPLPKSTLMFNLMFRETTVRGGIGGLPAITSDVEHVFPERFVRDTSGNLLQVDTRPLNFEQSRQRVVSARIFGVIPLGPPSSFKASAATANPAAPLVPPASGGMANALGSGRPQATISLTHEWRLEDRLRLREGLPERDLLDGAAVSGRGPSRHMITGQANVTAGPVQATLSGRWRSGTVSRGDGAELRFSSLTTFDLRASYMVGSDSALGRAANWLVGKRAFLEVSNLFDAQTHVRDSMGNTPLAYQPAYIDPLGRMVRVGVRALI